MATVCPSLSSHGLGGSAVSKTCSLAARLYESPNSYIKEVGKLTYLLYLFHWIYLSGKQSFGRIRKGFNMITYDYSPSNYCNISYLEKRKIIFKSAFFFLGGYVGSQEGKCSIAVQLCFLSNSA